MICDANGRPDPNGDFQLIDGNVCLREGRPIRFEMAFMDAASDAAQLTDAAVMAIAKARQKHSLRYGYLAADQRPAFTAADEAAALASEARAAADRRLAVTDASAEISRARGFYVAVRETRKAMIRDAWRSKSHG